MLSYEKFSTDKVPLEYVKVELYLQSDLWQKIVKICKTKKISVNNKDIFIEKVIFLKNYFSKSKGLDSAGGNFLFYRPLKHWKINMTEQTKSSGKW